VNIPALAQCGYWWGQGGQFPRSDPIRQLRHSAGFSEPSRTFISTGGSGAFQSKGRVGEVGSTSPLRPSPFHLRVTLFASPASFQACTLHTLTPPPRVEIVGTSDYVSFPLLLLESSLDILSPVPL
jgi:hypothetical protein